MHSVKAAAQMTGLSPDTLRAWERRYGAVRPERDTRGRRIYNAEDLTKLRLLGRVVALGHPIYRAAGLPIARLEQLLDEADNQGTNQRYTRLIKHALAGVDDYQAEVCNEALSMAMAILPPTEVVRHVFSPLLYEIGERWHRGEISMGQEHLLSASMERLLMAMIHQSQKMAGGPRVVFGTLSGERHALGSLLAAFLASAHAIRCCYLGPDLPPMELAKAVTRSKASAVGLSLINLSAVHDPVTQLTELSARLPKSVELWLGGPAAAELSPHELPPGCAPVCSFEAYIQRLRALKLSAAD